MAGPPAPRKCRAEGGDLVARLMKVRETISSLIRQAPGRVGLVVRDLATGEELAWAPDELFPAASVIKVPVLVEALRQVVEGRLELDGRVPVRPEDRVGGTGILKELTSVSELSLRDLLTLMIVVSDNTAANVCIDRVGMQAVNQTMASLGLARTQLRRKMMDFEARQRGIDNWITAADAARLLELVATKAVLTAPMCDLAIDILSRQQVRDRLPRLLPAEVRVAHKTGELPGVRHDVGILFLPQGPVVVSALTADFSTPASQGLSGGEGAELIARIGRIVYDALALQLL